jgi:hypothetical protein
VKRLFYISGRFSTKLAAYDERLGRNFDRIPLQVIHVAVQFEARGGYMKVFLSWSGARSKRVAEALGDWICQVIQAVEPWVSVDIEKGARWNKEIAAQLDSTEIGIFCLTKDNLQSPWLHFEAGALSKGQDGRVCTFMLDVHPTDVKPPLSDFQATTFEREDVQKLLFSLNTRLGAAGDRPLDEERLRRLFEKFWPELELKLKGIVADKGAASKVPERSKDDRLDEILMTVRRISSALDGRTENWDGLKARLVQKLQRTVENENLTTSSAAWRPKGLAPAQDGSPPDGTFIDEMVQRELLGAIPPGGLSISEYENVLNSLSLKTGLDPRTLKQIADSLLFRNAKEQRSHKS